MDFLFHWRGRVDVWLRGRDLECVKREGGIRNMDIDEGLVGDL